MGKYYYVHACDVDNNNNVLIMFSQLGCCRIAVPEYGLMHLDLIPMLVGFFTYKIATFFQAIEEAVKIVENKPNNSET